MNFVIEFLEWLTLCVCFLTYTLSFSYILSLYLRERNLKPNSINAKGRIFTPKLKVTCPRSSIIWLGAEAKTQLQGTGPRVAFVHTQGAWDIEDLIQISYHSFCHTRGSNGMFVKRMKGYQSIGLKYVSLCAPFYLFSL